MQFAAPSPLEYFASLVADDGSLNLLEAAISLAQDEQPDLDVQSVLAEVDALSLRLRRRLTPDTVPAERLRLLLQFFHGELGFAGNLNDYYAAENSYVHRVLVTRRGIPITLGVLLLELAEQAGLRASGVAFPGHFLVKVRMGLGEVVIDPFTGDELSTSRLDERLAVYRRASQWPADLDLPLEFFLRPAAPRQILARMLRNLREVHRAAGDMPRQLAVQHRLVRLLPDDPVERRERGVLLDQGGDMQSAADDYGVYLQQRADAADAEDIRSRLAALRRRPPQALQ